MKGNISLGDFIKQVKRELVEAQCTKEGEAFYELHDVELEVSFALEAKGEAKGRLVVIELGGMESASQMHKVTLKLKPITYTPPYPPRGVVAIDTLVGWAGYGGGMFGVPNIYIINIPEIAKDLPKYQYVYAGRPEEGK